MKNQLIMWVLIAFLNVFLGSMPTQAQPNSESIVGTWMPGDKQSHIIIYKQGNRFFGKLHLLNTGTYPDSKNPDPGLQKRNLEGITMLNNFVADGDGSWTNGTLYDPNSGKTYSCKISMTIPNELKVRGYVGISVFGRTEVFTRVR